MSNKRPRGRVRLFECLTESDDAKEGVVGTKMEKDLGQENSPDSRKEAPEINNSTAKAQDQTDPGSSTTNPAGEQTYKVISIPSHLRYWSQKNAMKPLTIEELTFVCYGTPETPAPKNLHEAVQLRCKILDALFVFLLPESRRPPVIWTNDRQDRRLGPGKEDTWNKAFMYHFLIAVCNGELCVEEDLLDSHNIPKVLTSDLRMRKPPIYYAEMIASFDIRRADGIWLSWLKIEEEDEAKIDFSTRSWRPYVVFKSWKTRPGLPVYVNRACHFCKILARLPPSWDYHPLTWRKAVKDMLDPVHENTWSLMHQALNAHQISTLEHFGGIPRVRPDQPECLKWVSWDPDDVIKPTRLIFQAKSSS